MMIIFKILTIIFSLHVQLVSSEMCCEVLQSHCHRTDFTNLMHDALNSIDDICMDRSVRRLWLDRLLCMITVINANLECGADQFVQAWQNILTTNQPSAALDFLCLCRDEIKAFHDCIVQNEATIQTCRKEKENATRNDFLFQQKRFDYVDYTPYVCRMTAAYYNCLDIKQCPDDTPRYKYKLFIRLFMGRHCMNDLPVPLPPTKTPVHGGGSNRNMVFTPILIILIFLVSLFVGFHRFSWF